MNRPEAMRIFFPNASIKDPPSRGGDIHRYQLIKNLTELGHTVHTLYPDQNPFTVKHRKSPWPVLQQVRSADVIYCRLEIQPNAATKLTSPLTRWLVPRRTPVVWELNVSLAYSLNEQRSPAEVDRSIARLRRSAARVDAAICVTRQLADEARDLLGIRSTHVLQNGSDPEMFHRDLPFPMGFTIDRNRLNVVFMASGTESYHDIPLICAVAARTAEHDLPIDFHVIGKSEALIPADRPANLHGIGPVSYLDLPNYLAAMDVGLVLYNMSSDGLSPLKLFDYLASGCVPICSSSQPMHEVLDGSGAGFVGDWNVESLTSILTDLSRDRGRLEQMRTAARAIIERKYSWRRIAEQTVDIIAGAGNHDRLR